MYDIDNKKQSQYNTIFFTTKILAMFFSVSPLLQYCFRGDSSASLQNINMVAFIIPLIVMALTIFMSITMNSSYKKSMISIGVEVLVLYSVCLSSVMISGTYQSYYKFMFIFLVVAYTIEFGYKVGIFIASISSFTILIIDLIYFKSSGVNPFLQADIAMASMFLLVAWSLGFYVKTERKHIEDLKEYANLDGLTEAYNHRYLHESLKEWCQKSKSESIPLSFIILDIDYFKNFNDLYGHQQGDEVLKTMVRIIKENARKNDVICRYGGEEFAIILPDMTQKDAVIYANRLRTKISGYAFEGEEFLPKSNLTVSIGVSVMTDENDTPKNIINRADSALYRAKFFRKDRVEIYSSVFDQFKHLDKKTEDGMLSVKSLITIINSRDMYTSNHTDRVVYYCNIFADYLHLDSEKKKLLIYASYLHDIGKINVSKEILISEKKLIGSEWEEMKRHSSDSAEIVRRMDGLENVADIVLQHHEKYDGTGYPLGCKGEDINYLARMLTLADAFDAMTAKRPYQEKRSYEEAFDEIRRCKSTQFDPILAEKFIEAINEFV